jgi:hypothetical protein
LIKLNARAGMIRADEAVRIQEAAMSASSSFTDLLQLAAGAHASELTLRVENGQASVVAMVRGDAAQLAQWPESEAAPFLAQAFAVCDGADDFVPGVSRMMRMTGERAALPAGVATALVQFLPPREGGRHLVVRLSYEGDVCCGTCGGGG